MKNYIIGRLWKTTKLPHAPPLYHGNIFGRHLEWGQGGYGLYIVCEELCYVLDTPREEPCYRL